MNYWTFSPCICLIKDPPNQLWNEDKVARLVSGQSSKQCLELIKAIADLSSTSQELSASIR